MQSIPSSVSRQDAAFLLRDKYGGKETEAYRQDLKRLAAGEPLAYIIGWIPFLGLRIFLDARPLIPRPETEWWTEKLIQYLQKNLSKNPLAILDLGAGSGAIGCAILAALPRARVTFVDKEARYAQTIEKNIATNGIARARVTIRTGDLFNPVAQEKFDIVATNPPYIPLSRTIPLSVEKYEPLEALRAGEDGLALIRRIAQNARAHLRAKGQVWVEVDSAHARHAEKIFRAKGMETELHRDLYGRRRLIIAATNLSRRASFLIH